MAKQVLGISWLNGRFDAAALNGGTVSGSWLCPTAVNDETDFAIAIGEAARQTQFTGKQIILVLDHRSLVFHVQETPPAAEKLVGQMLERLVERNQFFEGKAVWSRLDLPSAKDKRRFLLALLPEALVQNLVRACGDRGLELAAIFPVAAVLGTDLRALAVAAGETVLLAIDLGGALHLLLGKGDGTVLFSRTLLTGAAIGTDRVLQEINRTVHFAQQQFAAKVTQIFVLGEGAFGVLKESTIGNGVKVQLLPTPKETVDYARRAATLSSRPSLNLISPAGGAKRRREQIAAVGIAALFCLSLSAAVLTQMDLRAREVALSNFNLQQEAEDQKHAAEHKLQTEAARWQSFVWIVGSTNDPAVPALFARYVGGATPEAMRLTLIDVNRTTNGWNCRIEGVLREKDEGFIAQMEAFERQLQSGVFKLRITDSSGQQLFRGTTKAGSTTHDAERPFFVTGTIP